MIQAGRDVAAFSGRLNASILLSKNPSSCWRAYCSSIASLEPTGADLPGGSHAPGVNCYAEESATLQC